MNDRILSLLGLCRKAHKLSLGYEAALNSVKKHTAELLIFTSDISANTESKLSKAANDYGAAHIKINRTQQQLGDAIGQYCVVVCVNDANFAESLSRYILTESEE